MSHDSHHHEKNSDTCNAASDSDYCEPGGPCEVDCVDGCVDKSTADIPHTGFGDCGCADCWPADPIGCSESSDAALSTRCACKTKCGDVSEADDNPLAVCKALPSPPREPPVEIVLVHRGEK